MDFAKIPSGEITNYPLLNFQSKNYKKIILSTGMSNVREIDFALKIFKKNNIKKSNIFLLHCTSSYPAPVDELNMNSMLYLKKKFKLSVGYSDHSDSVITPVIATTLGAEIIEKHFTVNKNYPGPDHKSSVNVSEFTEIVKSVRFTNLALGNFEKKCTKSEKKNKKLVRKSIYALDDIKKGEIFTEKNIITLRPERGIKANQWNRVLGKKSKKNIKKFDLITI